MILLAGNAWASNITEVRTGVHQDFTRVVLQLDASTPYSLDRLVAKENGTQVLFLSVQAAAQSMERVAPRGSPHLKGVAVASRPDGTSEIRIRMRGELELKEMVLRSPDRIVLDFYPEGSRSGPLVSALVSPDLDANVAGAEAPAPIEVAQRPSIEESHDTEFNQALVEAESALEAARGSAPPEPEGEASGAIDELEAGLEADLVAADEGSDALQPEAEIAFDEGAENGAADSQAETETGAFAGVEVAELVPEELTPMAADSPDSTDSGGSLLGSPFALAAIAGVALIGLLFVLGRRRKGGVEDESLSPLDAADDAAEPDAGISGLFGARGSDQEVVDADAPAPFVGESRETHIEPDAIIASDDANTNDSPSEEPTVDEGFDYPAISPASSGDASSASPLSAPSDLGNSEVAKVVEEFERRIAHLESRLEEVFDAKDRLERQVAAQTEELRVQRAAIARTQRVLRTIARPEDDEPSEPVPKL